MNRKKQTNKIVEIDFKAKIIKYNKCSYYISVDENGDVVDNHEYRKFYRDCTPQLNNIIKKYQRRYYHIDKDDIISYTNLAWLKLIKKFRPEKSSWSTWFHSFFEFRLQNELPKYSEDVIVYTESDMDEPNYLQNFENPEEETEE